MFYLMTHSTHFYLRLYGVSDSEKGNIGYSLRLTARVLLYAPSHRQDSTYHSLCYTSRGALAGTRNYFLFQPVLHKWCNKGSGMFYPVCGMLDIKKRKEM